MVNIINSITLFMQNLGVVGIFLSCFIIIFESIIPVVPVFIFFILNAMVLGNFWGYIVSYLFHLIGCIISFLIFKNGLGNKFERFTSDKEKINKYKNKFKDISIPQLAVLASIPFGPAFAINVAAGLSKMNFKKYIIAISVGKLSFMYFLIFIGTSLVESFKDPKILIKVVIILGVSYGITYLLKKIFKFDM